MGYPRHVFMDLKMFMLIVTKFLSADAVIYGGFFGVGG